MAQGKVVFMARVEPELRDVFIAEAPADLCVVAVDPRVGKEEIAAQVRDADFVVTYRSGYIPEEVVRGAGRLKLIQTMGQGTDHIPKRVASERGIYVANSGGVNAVAVAEHAVMLMLATMKRLLPSVEALRQGKFQEGMQRRDFRQLYEKVVGIVGLGNIGRRVAKLVTGFGADVIFCEEVDIPESITADFRTRQVSLGELLSTADVVTLHVPLQESTRGMIGWEQLAMMKSSAILINTSRGGVVDEAVLIRALREKKIAGLGTDVFEQEPPSPSNPLLNMDNVVATPHIGGQVWENWMPRVRAIWRNLLRVREGKEPHNVVRAF